MSKKEKPRKLKGTKDGWIYILDIGYDNLYKIGMTQRINRRLADLGKSNPKVKIEMAYLVLNAKKIESNLHRNFKAVNYKWEIFELQTYDLNRIKRYLRAENRKFFASRRKGINNGSNRETLRND